MPRRKSSDSDLDPRVREAFVRTVARIILDQLIAEGLDVDAVETGASFSLKQLRRPAARRRTVRPNRP